MNEKHPFIIEDLDDFHLIIKADEEFRVRSELEVEVMWCLSLSCITRCINTYTAGEEYLQFRVTVLTEQGDSALFVVMYNDPHLSLGTRLVVIPRVHLRAWSAS